MRGQQRSSEDMKEHLHIIKEFRVEEGAMPSRVRSVAGVAEVPRRAVTSDNGQISLDPSVEHLSVINTFIGTVVGGADTVQILHGGG